MIDLHLHTSCSDGKETPEMMAAQAVELGMEAIAITDHDTLAGVEPARRSVNGTLRVISGMELSASDGGTPIHILGYGVDGDDSALAEVLSTVRDERMIRARDIVTKLNELHVDVNLEMVEEIAGDAPVTRAHIGYALVKHGFVRSQGEAFGRYLSNDGPAFVPQETLTPTRAIQAIHAADGVAVLAHPGITKRDELIKSFVREGLDGIESMHPNHTRTLMRYYERLAIRHNLITTGGSDAHGIVRMREHASTNRIPPEKLSLLEAAIEKRRSDA